MTNVATKTVLSAIVAAGVLVVVVTLGDGLYVTEDKPSPYPPGEAAQAQNGGEQQQPTETAAVSPVAAGEQVARKCRACHTFDKGGPNRVGPNLYNVVGSEKGGTEGYRYSNAFQNLSGTWTESELDAFLKNPMGDVKGTKMAFPGVKDDEDRQNLIEYLKSLSG